MLHHPWFTSGPIPTHVPSSALLLRPEYHEMSREQIKHNFAKVKKRAGVGATFALRVPAAETVETSQEVGREIDRAVKQQEAEYQTAIQPGSPISALLRWVVANSASGAQLAHTVLCRQVRTKASCCRSRTYAQERAWRIEPLAQVSGFAEASPARESVTKRSGSSAQLPVDQAQRSYQGGRRG